MRIAALSIALVALGVSARAETPRPAPYARSRVIGLLEAPRLPGLPYVTTRSGAPPGNALPPVQDLFPHLRINPLPDGAIIAKPSRAQPTLQLPLYRPPDRGLFRREHPLLTPQTPVHISPAKPLAPEPRP